MRRAGVREFSWPNCVPNSRPSWSAREQVVIAQERAEASERRALRELGDRTFRAKYGGVA